MGPRPEGRGNSARGCLPARLLQPSMGPRPEGRGNFGDLLGDRVDRFTFNGAATRRPRKPARAATPPGGCRCLQWGRDPKAAETARPGPLLPLGTPGASASDVLRGARRRSVFKLPGPKANGLTPSRVRAKSGVGALPRGSHRTPACPHRPWTHHGPPAAVGGPLHDRGQSRDFNAGGALPAWAIVGRQGGVTDVGAQRGRCWEAVAGCRSPASGTRPQGARSPCAECRLV